MPSEVIKLAPSILAADFARLGEEVAEAERAGADRIHVDVMDGHFVPNLSMGAPVVKSLRPVTGLPLETHLMISDPDFFLDEFAEAEKLLGGPAANPECLWLGRRVVSLLWRDDLDTAFRHLDLYDRFGCPAGHIQATFRCLVRQGNFDPKATDTLNSRVHGCWVNPNAEPQGTAAVPSGTTNR